VTLRPIFAILVAFAMLFSPFAMHSAMAATSGHHGQAMAADHCGEQSSYGKLDTSSGKPCCVAMCAAIAVAPPSPAENIAFAKPLHRPALVRASLSFLAKLPTPPPRFA
jgi:hypothetical protein